LHDGLSDRESYQMIVGTVKAAWGMKMLSLPATPETRIAPGSLGS